MFNKLEIIIYNTYPELLTKLVKELEYNCEEDRWKNLYRKLKDIKKENSDPKHSL